MATNTRDFILELASKRDYPQMRDVTGTVRFDIQGAGVWHLDIQYGQVVVSEQDLLADATVTCDLSVFDRIVRGEANAAAMFMQDQLMLSGDRTLGVACERLNPPPIPRPVKSERSVPEHPVTASTPVPCKTDQHTARSQTVSILDGNTFVISDRAGNIDASPTDTQGLFAWDTRFLSRWLLTVNGITPYPLSTDDLEYYAVRFFLVPTTGTVYVDAKLSVIRIRQVNGGFEEQITILNHANQPVDLAVRLEVGADFADVFEVKDALSKQGSYDQRIEEQRLVLGYQRDHFHRETWIETDRSASIDAHSLSYIAHIAPQEEWSTTINVIAQASVAKHFPALVSDLQAIRAAKQQDLARWTAATPTVSSSWAPIVQTYQRSIVDLAALRYRPLMFGGNASLLAAGLPWFMAIFGRDSILASLQVLPFNAELAMTTLATLAVRQGAKIDDFRDEEPGKILHEMRYGEMAAFEERPSSPYYGSADATPLFLILLDEVERWTGNADLVHRLEWNARAALDWIDQYGDRNQDGYVEYHRRNAETGLENQCWKDSWDSILFADGTLSKLPRATCEIQGYVYDAKRRCARLARQFWNDPALAERLEREAEVLKERFNRDYWLADRGYYALAIDVERDGKSML